MASNLRLPLADVRLGVCFEMPESEEAYRYQQWVAASGVPGALGVGIVNASTFAEARGEAGLQRHRISMAVRGFPFFMVQVAWSAAAQEIPGRPTAATGPTMYEC